MRFRTKLLLTGGGVVVLLWLGTLGAVRHTIEENSNHLADLDFDGTRKSLDSLRAERVARMRQAGSLVMSIPELRALIAEHNYEVSSENVNSLQERLDSLKDMVGVSFICVLDARGALIVQNHGSPWKDLAELDRYVTQPRQALLVKGLFDSAPGTGRTQGRYALWEYQGRVYEVVGQALVFNASDGSSGPAPADGALIMAAPLTDSLAVDLAASHNCQVTFLAEGQLAACSLPSAARTELLARTAGAKLPSGQPFDMRLSGVNYRSFLEELIDPCSGQPVGRMLIQCSRVEAEAASRHVSNRLLFIMATALGLAACVSVPLSAAVTRPVRQLVRGARQVAGGDLNLLLPAERGDELGELARAFNDMVVQLRAREELRRLVETSQAANKAKSQFLANMSHEIRTPLNGVIGIADLLLRTDLSARQRRYAGLVKSSAEVLTTLINDILDFSKIEAGKLELEAIDFDLHAVAQDVVELMTPRASAKGIKLLCAIHPDVPPAVRGDPNRLRQIIMNLIGNAIKFTDAGHVRLGAGYDHSVAGGTARFEIQDTGIGIPTERMDRLFKSFSQVDASTTRRYGGTGLGLAICKQLAELMGGRIGVDSQPGNGSTFWFTAALGVAEKPIVAHPAPVASVRAVHPFRILLAEDNEVNQIVAADLLAEAGYACDIVRDGKQAVEAVTTGRYDLVLMDCQMPLMDGFEAAKEIRRQEQAAMPPDPARRRVPIIALTANASDGDQKRCIEAGMDDYCGKPFEPRQFLGKVAGLLPPVPSSTGVPPVSSIQDPTNDGCGHILCGGPDPGAMGKRTRLPVESPANRQQHGQASTLAHGTNAGIQTESSHTRNDGNDAGATQRPPIDIDSLLRRCSGKPALAKVVLAKFEKQVAEMDARLDGCERTGDAAELARAAHALKGTAGIVAADDLFRLAARLEEVGLAGDLALIQQSLAGVREEIRRCAQYAAGRRELSDLLQEPTDARADR